MVGANETCLAAMRATASLLGGTFNLRLATLG